MLSPTGWALDSTWRIASCCQSSPTHPSVQPLGFSTSPTETQLRRGQNDNQACLVASVLSLAYLPQPTLSAKQGWQTQFCAGGVGWPGIKSVCKSGNRGESQPPSPSPRDLFHPHALKCIPYQILFFAKKSGSLVSFIYPLLHFAKNNKGYLTL